MTDYQIAVLAHAAVKVTIVLAGALCVILGYRLFEEGLCRGGADINVRAWKTVIAMDRGGPGLVFALFGAIVIIVGALHTTTTTSIKDSPAGAVDPPEQPTPIAPTAPKSTGRDGQPARRELVRLEEYDVGF
jgi:hypothetical protein